MTLKVGGLYWTKTRDTFVLITEHDARATATYKFKGRFVMSPYSNPDFDQWTDSGEFNADSAYAHSYDLVEEVTDPVLLAFYGN